MRIPTQTGAKGLITGTISNGATWRESFEISENNAELADADTSVWKLVFKDCDSGSPVLTLTSGAEITVTQNGTETIFAINTLGVSLKELVGDYHADFACQAVDGTVTHWGSGIVTFIDENLGF